MKNSGFGRSRFDSTGPGLPASELWGRAQKDGNHALVYTADRGWTVTERSSGKRVKQWGCGRTARQST